MIVEERTYDLHPGSVAEYTALVQQEGIAIQRPILGRLIGYFSTEIGPLNQIVHLWAYDSLEDRAARRAKLAADPRWQAYSKKVKGFSMRQQNKILTPMSFSPEPAPWQPDDSTTSGS